MGNFENNEEQEIKPIEKDGKTYEFICYSKEVKEGKGKRIAFEDDIDHQFAIFRINNKLYCVSNICPHRHATRIFEGIITGLTVTCPLHGWTYSLPTGENVNRKQGIKKLDTYDIFETDGLVYMEKPQLKIPKWREGRNISSGQNPVFD